MKQLNCLSVSLVGFRNSNFQIYFPLDRDLQQPTVRIVEIIDHVDIYQS